MRDAVKSLGKVVSVVATLGLAWPACTLPQPRMVSTSPQGQPGTFVSRLGRWTGERFVGVEVQSVPASRLRVLVHGWTPGTDRAWVVREKLRSWELVTLPAPEGRHRFEPWLANLAERIARADPHAVVLAYSWVEDSSTVRAPLAERRALGRTNLHGALLARALDEALAPDFFDRHGQIHVLGHSYGGRVATVAAVERARAGAAIDHLTIFDAPDAVLTRVSGSHTDIPSLLRGLPIGWGRGRTFVDNYVSVVGRRYGPSLERGENGERRPPPPMLDVVLSPPAAQFAYRPRHLYPMQFYARSPGSGVGFDWSPLTGRREPPRRGCWEQRAPEDVSLVYGCTGVP